ncbi:MAG: hypothetical protein EPN48_03795 [Microbacteriaceae bacterium]|nr:MAG: hypothetical protein EPN48_03795 [Microbacteriaceae bacterium]
MTATIVADADIAQRVASTLEPVFRMVDDWRDVVEREFAAGVDSAARIDPLIAGLVAPEFDREGGLITGAGFVAAPGFLADAPWHLAWWLSASNTFGRAANGGLRRLQTVDDPDDEQFRDYTALEWWRVPARTGGRHLTGPYVDYLCTDDYTVTITTPVRQGGQMVGLVGTDVYVARLEQVLLPVLRASGRACTLVNASGRIVASTDSRRATGALLRIDGLGAALAPLREREASDSSAQAAGIDRSAPLPSTVSVVACGDTSLALVIAD